MSTTYEREIAEETEKALLREVAHPQVVIPRKPPRLVRWLEWLVVLAIVAGAAVGGFFLLGGDDTAEIRADLLGTRYREAGVAVEPLPGPDVAEAAHLTAIADAYVARNATELPGHERMITTAVPLPQPEPAPAHGESLRPVPGHYGGPL